MNKLFLILSLCVVTLMAHATQPVSFYDFRVSSLQGEKVKLAQYRGKVVLVVNTASKCGLTPQYEGLEALYQRYSGKGFVVLGFPCNQFRGQEPGTAEEIQQFCSLHYHVTFPMFEKLEVNGPNTHPLYVFLKAAQALEGKNDIRWNFEKFLIDRKGNVVKRYAPGIKPEALIADLETLL